jgi:hypothetical protein
MDDILGTHKVVQIYCPLSPISLIDNREDNREIATSATGEHSARSWR